MQLREGPNRGRARGRSQLTEVGLRELRRRTHLTLYIDGCRKPTDAGLQQLVPPKQRPGCHECSMATANGAHVVNVCVCVCVCM
jgi:hypothetical protein